jgi:hypothetical protein
VRLIVVASLMSSSSCEGWTIPESRQDILNVYLPVSCCSGYVLTIFHVDFFSGWCCFQSSTRTQDSTGQYRKIQADTANHTSTHNCIIRLLCYLIFICLALSLLVSLSCTHKERICIHICGHTK